MSESKSNLQQTREDYALVVQYYIQDVKEALLNFYDKQIEASRPLTSAKVALRIRREISRREIRLQERAWKGTGNFKASKGFQRKPDSLFGGLNVHLLKKMYADLSKQAINKSLNEAKKRAQAQAKHESKRTGTRVRTMGKIKRAPKPVKIPKVNDSELKVLIEKASRDLSDYLGTEYEAMFNRIYFAYVEEYAKRRDEAASKVFKTQKDVLSRLLKGVNKQFRGAAPKRISPIDAEIKKAKQARERSEVVLMHVESSQKALVKLFKTLRQTAEQKADKITYHNQTLTRLFKQTMEKIAQNVKERYMLKYGDSEAASLTFGRAIESKDSNNISGTIKTTFNTRAGRKKGGQLIGGVGKKSILDQYTLMNQEYLLNRKTGQGKLVPYSPPKPYFFGESQGWWRLKEYTGANEQGSSTDFKTPRTEAFVRNILWAGGKQGGFRRDPIFKPNKSKFFEEDQSAINELKAKSPEALARVLRIVFRK